MKARVSPPLLVFMLLVILGAAVGCSKAPTDAQITSQLQDKINADSGLQGKQLGVQAANGVITLSGAVDNDVQREAAARYAAAIPGVKEVVNNLQVAPAPPVAEEASPAPPPVEEKSAPAKHKPVASKKPKVERVPESPATEDQARLHNQDSASPMMQPVTAAPPPPPPPQKVTIPAGSTLAIRLIDAIDSEKNQPGETFHATLNSPLAVDGEVAIPAGYDVEGHIVDVKSAGKFAGQSLLVLQLDRISVNGKSYSIQTDQYKRQGSSRGKNTAEKVGAGAAIGAIIGGIAAGGKGAGIGAAAGGGLGGGVQAATKGQQIKLPSETVLNFSLENPLSVVPVLGPDANRHKLDTPSQQ
jgi:hypothetical protein